MNIFLYVILFVLIYIISSCKGVNDEYKNKELVDYQGETHIEIKVSHCTDTTILRIQSRTLIPLNIENIEIIIAKDSTYKTTLKSTHPYLGSLFIQNTRYPLFTVPNDTLKISIDLDLNLDKQEVINYNGKIEPINNFYLEKSNRFNYPDIAIPATNYTSPSYSIYEGAEKIDSLFREEQKFLSTYTKRSKLPNWFIQMENMNLSYYKAGFKIGAISSRNYFNNENTKVNDVYFNFLDTIQINNPKAYLSSEYYVFLTSYFSSQTWEKFENSESGFARAYPILESMLPITIKELSGEIRANFLAYIFSRYFLLYTEQTSHILKVDSLLDSFSGFINDEMLIDAVKKNKNSKIEKFEEKSFLSKGEKAPDFYLSDINGKFYSLKDFKGKVIYLNFWATWCSPCIKTLPEKNSLIKEYTNKPIEFINISFDKENDKWEKFIRNNEILGLNLICKGKWEDILKTKYYIQGIPKYILIDENGKVIESNAVPPTKKSDLVELIDNYLK